jgi:hypothetical protein
MSPPIQAGPAPIFIVARPGSGRMEITVFGGFAARASGAKVGQAR